MVFSQTRVFHLNLVLCMIYFFMLLVDSIAPCFFCKEEDEMILIVRSHRYNPLIETVLKIKVYFLDGFLFCFILSDVMMS